MKHTRKMSSAVKLLVALVLLVLMTAGCMITASADDLEWNLLTDKDAGFVLEDKVGTHTGTPAYEVSKEGGDVVAHKPQSNPAGAYYIYDDNNILGTYKSFSLEGDFYFESIPSGTRFDSGVSIDEAPLSFLCWGYEVLASGATITTNALRINGEGRLILPNGTGSAITTDIKLSAGRWYNIKINMMPESGRSELFINGESVSEFNIIRYDSRLYKSSFVRYFDGFFDWGVKMKNLIVKTDSSYVIGEREEPAADYVGYQTKKAEDGSFTLRTILGVNSTDYSRIGYEIIRLERDYDGNIISEAISDRSKVVFEEIKDAAGKTYAAQSDFGYKYVAAIEVPNLPEEIDYDSLEIVVRPYVRGMDGLRLYGESAILTYTGETDDDGYPVLDRQAERFATITPVADTFIYAGYKNPDFGGSAMLQAKNIDETNIAPERATYYKFHFTPEQVKMIETSASVQFCVYTEFGLATEMVELIVHGTGADWDESTLKYETHTTLATTQEYITSATALNKQYVYFDVLQYLNEQMLNEDGSLTVSFRVVNAGSKTTFSQGEGKKDYNPVYIHSKEKSKETAPKVQIVTSIYSVETNLVKISNVGYEPWGYAEKLVDEWFYELADKVYPKDANGNVIIHDVNDNPSDGYAETEAAGDFTAIVDWQSDNYIWVSPNYWEDHPNGVKREDEWEKDRFARTLSTLGTSTANAYLTSSYAQAKSEYDIYGGISNSGINGTPTGYFHTEIHNGRTYIIDPLGNPYFAVGVDDFSILYHTDWSIETYGSEEGFYEATTKKLQDMGINTAHVSQKDQILAVDDGLSVVVDLSVVSAYMFSIGRSTVTEGQFPHNNTINVFDPDFAKMTNKNVTNTITSKGYATNPRVLGYTSDNELPGGEDILTRYLTVDPTEHTNAFSYATAWTWLARRMNVAAPTLEEYLASPDILEMNSEFLSFIYTTYYGVTRDAIESVDPNHMYMGSRVASNCRFDEGYLRAAGYQLDIITTNLYTGLHFPWDGLVNYYRYAGKPFLITEFYAKSMDAIDDNGFTMANSTGAGSVVKTQQARADYYEHQTMLLIESNACVGWTWYCMLDNDQPLHKSTALDKLGLEVVMAFVSYGEVPPVARSFVDRDGNVYSADAIGKFDTIDPGNSMASNHNCNKGIFNRNYLSTVVVYTYDANGKLLSTKGHWVEDPTSATPKEGTKLREIVRNLTVENTSKASLAECYMSGSQIFTIGKAPTEDGGYTETILTTYQGTYVALATAMRNISDNLMGLVNYFDGN